MIEFVSVISRRLWTRLTCTQTLLSICQRQRESSTPARCYAKRGLSGWSQSLVRRWTVDDYFFVVKDTFWIKGRYTLFRRLSMDGEKVGWGIFVDHFCEGLIDVSESDDRTRRVSLSLQTLSKHWKNSIIWTLEHFSSSPIPKPYRVIPFSKYKKYKREVERFLNGTSLDKRSRWQKQFSSKNEQPTYVTDTLDTDELIGSGGWELHANPCRWSVSSVPWRSQGCKWRDRVAEDQPVTQQFLSSSLATPFFESPLNDNNYFDPFAKWMKIESKKEEKNFEALHEKRSSNNDRAEACLNPYSNRVIPAVCLRLSSSSSRA